MTNTWSDIDFSYDQAVLVELALADIDGTGKDYLEEVRTLERQLEKKLPADAGLDGHDMGQDEAIIYIYGPSADKIFTAIEQVLRKSPFNYINVTLQYGLPDDPETKEKKFTL